MAVLFISDLHLAASRPMSNQQFFALLAGPVREAYALYILGDLFDYWAGDDDLADPFNLSVVDALRACAAVTPIFIMRGNRDFLLGERFAAASGVRLIDDPMRINLYGISTLLLHGDAQCTDDEDYQRFRAEVRSPAWISAFLATPLPERKTRIEALRAQSETEKQRKPLQIMDVNRHAVETLLREHGYPRLIHGHTHRPAKHEHWIDEHHCERWVLGDWYECGSYLRCDASGISSVTL
jgi:UDP-2,3-diacylglucosamine hydrolase